jgi:hypothetical protein
VTGNRRTGSTEGKPLSVYRRSLSVLLSTLPLKSYTSRRPRVQDHQDPVLHIWHRSRAEIFCFRGCSTQFIAMSWGNGTENVALTRALRWNTQSHAPSARIVAPRSVPLQGHAAEDDEGKLPSLLSKLVIARCITTVQSTIEQSSSRSACEERLLS